MYTVNYCAYLAAYKEKFDKAKTLKILADYESHTYCTEKADTFSEAATTAFASSGISNSPDGGLEFCFSVIEDGKGTPVCFCYDTTFICS